MKVGPVCLTWDSLVIQIKLGCVAQAQGCISPRVIASEISKYENQRTKNKSTYWVLFELLWRDYFRSALCQQGFLQNQS